jgi:hypothetical protein
MLAHMFVHARDRVQARTCLHVHLRVGLRAHVRVHLCVCVRVHVRVRVHMRARVYLRLRAGMCVCVCVCACALCVCARVHAQVWAGAWACARVRVLYVCCTCVARVRAGERVCFAGTCTCACLCGSRQAYSFIRQRALDIMIGIQHAFLWSVIGINVLLGFLGEQALHYSALCHASSISSCFSGPWGGSQVARPNFKTPELLRISCARPSFVAHHQPKLRDHTLVDVEQCCWISRKQFSKLT